MSWIGIKVALTKEMRQAIFAKAQEYMATDGLEIVDDFSVVPDTVVEFWATVRKVE